MFKTDAIDFLPKIFDPWLVEFTDAEAMDTKLPPVFR